jgi:phosphonoacetate hydrolase
MRQGLFILVFFSSFLLVSSEARNPAPKAIPPRQKIIIIMFDGFGEEYYRSTKMPTLNFIETHGIYKVVPSLMPSVTNVNNTSICTGELPSKHGITGNSFYNAKKKEEEFMEEDSLVLTSTIFERAGRSGIRSALFSSKKKNDQSFITRYGFISFTGDSIGRMDKENWDTSFHLFARG